MIMFELTVQAMPVASLCDCYSDVWLTIIRRSWQGVRKIGVSIQIVGSCKYVNNRITRGKEGGGYSVFIHYRRS